jgi:hypothetical protein
MPITKIRFEDLEQGLTAPIAITSNSVNAVSIDGNTFSVDALNNRVGIGTVTPTFPLDVRVGDTYSHNGSFFLSYFGDTAASQYFGKVLYGTPNTISGGMEIENTTLNGNYSQKLHFHTHNFANSVGRRMSIDENGNVGIGTTAPTAKLQVVGLPSFADNAAAITGGLTVGAFYHTAGVLKVVI